MTAQFRSRMVFNEEAPSARRIPINGRGAIRRALFFTVILLACNPLIPSRDEEPRISLDSRANEAPIFSSAWRLKRIDARCQKSMKRSLQRFSNARSFARTLARWSMNWSIDRLKKKPWIFRVAVEAEGRNKCKKSRRQVCELCDKEWRISRRRKK